ncbi:2-oxoglutarate dehydrogenase complex E2 component [Coemansia linderi]|uniref:2-oxoglutarate dehydrogenase complex E2 component n=1 Tax=Coemansia linderi TaxID=2663919 RepID=A0ACC1KMA1_9FUNG|nr:2-oxoglutarate dehydrogenase complex E2 component [Coemansia linderi]
MLCAIVADAKYRTIKVPHMADSITEGTLKSWAKLVGEQVEQDEEVASIETDKVDIPVNSPVGGVIRELLAKEEDTVVVGQDLFKIEEGATAEGGAAPSAPKAAEPTPNEPVATPKKSEPAAPAAPAAQPVAAPKEAPVKESKPAASASPVLFGTAERSERRVKMNRMRLRISERLKQSQNTAASLTTFNEIDMSNLIDLRKTYKDDVLKTHGVKLGYMGAFVKASTHALQAVPEVNASIDGDHLVYYDYCDVSVAVATPKGLVTPVLRNTERMSIVDVEQEIANLGKKARDNKITVEDMAGGTFTISNGGAVTFLVKLKEVIEDPRRLLLSV